MELSSIASPLAQPAQQHASQIDRKAQEFEALVLSQMLAPMFENTKGPSLLGGGKADQDAFQSLLHDEYAKAIAARGGVGIADFVKDVLIQMQGAISDKGELS